MTPAQAQRVRAAPACEKCVAYFRVGRDTHAVSRALSCDACMRIVIAAAEIPVSIVADNFAASRRLTIAIAGGRATVARIGEPCRKERRTGEGNAPVVRRTVDALTDGEGVTDLDLDVDDDVRWLFGTDDAGATRTA